MIQVRVRQDDGMNLRRPNRQWMPVPFAQFLQSLEQSAIDEHAAAVDFEEMFGARYGARGTEELKRHAKYPICPPVCQKRMV